MVITVASTKGGVGKSTLLANLAISFLSIGKDVFVIDADKQGTLVMFNEIREQFAPEKTQLKVASANGKALEAIADSQSKNGSIVLIDSAGVDNVSTRSALAIADIILTASAPTPADLWALGRLSKLIDKLGEVKGIPVDWFLILNKVHPNAKDLDFVAEYLENASIYPNKVLDTIVRNRSAYADSFAYGLGVVEYTDKKASEEIENLSKEILKLLK
jgi:chromosome partitioning protein